MSKEMSKLKKRSIDDPCSSCLIDLLACICTLTLSHKPSAAASSSSSSSSLKQGSADNDIISRIFDGEMTKAALDNISDRNVLWSCLIAILQEDPLFVGESSIVNAATYLPVYLKRLMGALLCTAELLVQQDASTVYEVGQSLQSMMDKGIVLFIDTFNQ